MWRDRAGYDSGDRRLGAFHGDAANLGFADVDTKPAAGGSLSVPGLGTFALGAGPVIAPDGSVYLGTQEGKLLALHADGKPFWSRDIDVGEAIVASPAIGADGRVYVIGAKLKITRIGTIKKTQIGSTLYAFSATGALLARTSFPKRGLHAPTTAPPNIISVGDREIILAPALYRKVKNGVDMRLIGFSTNGGVALDELVAPQPGVDVITGGGPSASDLLLGFSCGVPTPATYIYCQLKGGFDYNPQRSSAAPSFPPPLPGVAVFTFAGGGASQVIISDQRHTIVDFTVTGLSRASPKCFETAIHSAPCYRRRWFCRKGARSPAPPARQIRLSRAQLEHACAGQ